MSNASTPTPDYTGKFVFIEHSNPQNAYNNGEYFCVRQTPGTLYAIKPVIGYGGHSMKAFALVGTDPARVVESWADDKAARSFVEDQLAWSDQIKNPEYKKAWIESVYGEARETALMAKRALERRNAPESIKTFVVTVPSGVRQLVINLNQ
jgi:hypothetical protein